jgi:uroporphyrin-III C-methyltransferase
VIYDNLVGPEIRAMIPTRSERIYVGKESSNHTLPQDEISRLLVAKAREGRQVVRLKGGDPFVFGRGGEEMQILMDAGIDFEIVPGITAALGAAASTGIPLTHRDFAQSCVFVTGHRKDGSLDLDWQTLSRQKQTVVIYMGIGAIGGIAARLIAHGLPATTPVAIVRHATLPDQLVLTGTLATMAERAAETRIQPPALIIIGEVVSLYDAATVSRRAAIIA